jgi:hypothetical protein
VPAGGNAFACDAVACIKRDAAKPETTPSAARDGFPPRSTVYNIFCGFQRDDVWEAIWAEFHPDLREASGREASPTAAAHPPQDVLEWCSRDPEIDSK